MTWALPLLLLAAVVPALVWLGLRTPEDEALRAPTGGPAAEAPRFASDWAATDMAQARLVFAGTDPQGVLRFGVHIELEPGWRTYWRTPGDSGYPPLFDWSASENVADISVRFPAPAVFAEPGDTYFGYEDEVVFLADVVPATKAPVRLDLAFSYAVCEAICVPLEADIGLEGDPEAAGTPFAPLLSSFAGRVPEPLEKGPEIDLRIRQESDGTSVLAASVSALSECAESDLIVETEAGHGHAAGRRQEETGRCLFSVPLDLLGDQADFAEVRPVFTLLGPERAWSGTAGIGSSG